MTARAWTEGPWFPYALDWRSVVGDDGDTVIADVRERNDTALIALAPEMAEAILAFTESWEANECDGIMVQRVHTDIYALAEKLRAIGGDQ